MQVRSFSHRQVTISAEPVIASRQSPPPPPSVDRLQHTDSQVSDSLNSASIQAHIRQAKLRIKVQAPRDVTRDEPPPLVSELILEAENAQYLAFQQGKRQIEFTEVWSAADRGNVDAQYMVAEMYFEGYGTKQHYRLAANYVKMAADRGDARSQTVYAKMLFSTCASTGNEAVGIQYLKNAIKQHYGPAYRVAGQLFETKVGGSMGRKRALAYYALARKYGD